MKNMNKWMLSTIVVSVASIIIIGFLTFRLRNQPKFELQDGQQLPESGEIPSGGPRGGQGSDENGFRNPPETEQSTESTLESEGLT